jgi:hypothetical protein
MYTGIDPVGFDIVHADGDKKNNAFSNLMLIRNMRGNATSRILRKQRQQRNVRA